MHDRSMHFQITPILAALCGCIGIALVVANFWFESDNLGFVGITFVALAATLRIRSWFVRLSARERAAFELGQESVRVRSLR